MADGAAPAHRDVGSGRVVVLLHGGVLDHRMWEPQIGPLARGHRVIAVDLRGHGGSSTPTGPFRHGDDVAALLRGLGVRSAVLVGVSLGAGTAVDVALEHPDLVEAVVISGAGSSDPDFRDPWILEVLARWAQAEEDRDRERWIEVFLELGAGPRGPGEVDAAVLDALRGMAVDTLDRHVPDGPPILPTPVPGARVRARSLTVPVLAVVGLLDAPDHIRMAREVAEAVGDGTVVEIVGAAHYPNLERPAEFTDAVLGFLARTAPGR